MFQFHQKKLNILPNYFLIEILLLRDYMEILNYNGNKIMI